VGPDARKSTRDAHTRQTESGIFAATFMGMTKLKTKLRGLSPQANYPDRATAAVGEVVPTFADRGVLRGQRNGSPRPLISIF
jgi:hypothetical protein